MPRNCGKRNYALAIFLASRICVATCFFAKVSEYFSRHSYQQIFSQNKTSGCRREKPQGRALDEGILQNRLISSLKGRSGEEVGVHA